MSEYRKTPGRNQLKRYYGPGVWEDVEGYLHFSIPDILAHLGMADTKENQALAREAIGEMLKKHAPESEIVDRATWED